MIPVYLCDDEAAVNALLEKLVGDQVMIMGRDMGPVKTAYDPISLLEMQKEGEVLF